LIPILFLFFALFYASLIDPTNLAR
jgi:hypothetical protein